MGLAQLLERLVGRDHRRKSGDVAVVDHLVELLLRPLCGRLRAEVIKHEKIHVSDAQSTGDLIATASPRSVEWVTPTVHN